MPRDICTKQIMADSDDESKNSYKEDEDDENYFKEALKQIEEVEKKQDGHNIVEKNENPLNGSKKTNLNVTTEGLSQDVIQNINLAQVNGLSQCHWCGSYHNNEMIINDKEGNVCKHCYFSVNYSEKDRFKFDTDSIKSKGHGIALYILECFQAHDVIKCTRKPECFLCDYKQQKPITNIVNPDMLGICDEVNKLSDDFSDDGVQNDQDEHKNYNVSSADFLEQNEKIMFRNGVSPNVMFKIPKKLVI